MSVIELKEYAYENYVQVFHFLFYKLWREKMLDRKSKNILTN